MFETMKMRSISKAIGLVLLLVLAVPPAFCLDCCCSDSSQAAKQKSGHDCCARPGDSSKSRTVSPADGCMCPELVTGPPRLLTTVSKADFDSKAPSDAGLTARPVAPSRPHTLAERPTESPPWIVTLSFDSASPRAPPAHHTVA